MKALETSKKWGLDTPKFTLSSQPLITQESTARFEEACQKILGSIPPETISQQCFMINNAIKDNLEEVFQSPLYFTLGYVEHHQKPVFYTPIGELKHLLKTGFTGGAMNLHAWLTTPNYEIIDLTFSTTFGVVRNDPTLYGRIAFQHHSKFNDAMIHHPQLVGDDFLKQIGALIDVGFLS